jgi:hypothetical protein
VRQSASRAFNSYFKISGKYAISSVVPVLLERLDAPPPKSENVFNGIKELVRIQGGPILEHLIPVLTQDPISISKAKTMSSLASVAGDYLIPYMNTVLRSLLIVLESLEQDLEIANNIQRSLSELFSSISQGGLDAFLEYILHYLITGRSAFGIGKVCDALVHFVSNSKIDYSEYIDTIFQALFPLFIQEKENVYISSWNVVNAICTSIPVESLANHLSVIRKCILDISFDRFYNRPRESVPALCLKNGINPFIPIYQFCLMNGSQEAREDAAHSIGELVTLTDLESFKPHVIKVTGPLIRIVGDRFHEGIRSAILDTLGIILRKAGNLLKPFVPQLQTTFVKALQDPALSVRDAASKSLGNLMALNIKKSSSLIEELVSIVNTAGQDPEISASVIKSMISILNECGQQILLETPKLKDVLSQLSMENLSSETTALAMNSIELGQILRKL